MEFSGACFPYQRLFFLFAGKTCCSGFGVYGVQGMESEVDVKALHLPTQRSLNWEMRVYYKDMHEK